MTTKKLPLSLTTAFTVFVLYWLILAVLAFVSALIGIFLPTFFFLYLLAGIGAFFSVHTMHFRSALAPLIPLVAVFVIVVTLWTLFSTPTVFTGRDQGSLANAAIMLADTHALTTHTPVSDAFFRYYGDGKALNFPGFFYTHDGALMTQFPIPYIAWIAVFYSVFGLFGFTIANGVLFLLFGLSFTLLLKDIVARLTRKVAPQRQAQYYGALFLLTSFPFMWFFRHTLSENLAQFLIFFLILQAMLFVRTTGKPIAPLHFWSAILTGMLLTFTRIEGVAIFAFMLLAFLIHPHTNNYLRTRLTTHLLAPAIGLLFAFAIVFNQTTNFYKMIVKALLPSGAPTTSVSSDGSALTALATRYTEYLSYGILPFLIAGAIGAYLLWRKKRYDALIPFLILAPTLIYLISPHISADAPWMLRRITFALLPLGMLYTVLLITIKQRLRYAVAALLVALALPATLTFFRFYENADLLRQTQTLAQQFTPTDLILIDAGVSGNRFAMLAGPFRTLHHKNAAYIFNPQDLTRIDFTGFTKVFLIVPRTNVARYTNALGDKLHQLTTFTITTSRLTHPPRTQIWDFPARDTVTTENIIYTVTR